MPVTKKKMQVSDTVRVTRDGRTTVDTARLFQKEHIRQMLEEMRHTIVVSPKKRERPSS